MKDNSSRKHKQAKAYRRQARKRQARAAAKDRGSWDTMWMQDKHKIGPGRNSAKYYGLGQKTKCVILIDMLKEHLGIVSEKGVLQIKKPLDAKGLSAIADTVVNMWPRDSEIVPRAATPDSSRLLFWGNRNPNSVANAITRSSLYADEILVVNPFVDLMLYNPQNSPLAIPDHWINVYTVHSVFFVLLEPWIKAGIVTVIENPACFSMELFNTLEADAIKRIGPRESGLGKKLVDLDIAESMAEILAQSPRDDWQPLLSLMGIDLPSGIKDISERAEIMAQADPLRASLPFHRSRNSIVSFGTGLSYEMALFASELFNGTILADRESSKMELETCVGNATEPLQQVANAFGEVELSFLNAIPSEIAIEIHQEGKVQAFRKYLCDLVHNMHYGDTDTFAKDFQDRLVSEYADYKNEWNDIQKRLAKEAFLKSPLAGIPPILEGNLQLIGGLAFAGVLGMSLIEGIRGRKKIERHPLAIMLHVDRKTKRRK